MGKSLLSWDPQHSCKKSNVLVIAALEMKDRGESLGLVNCQQSQNNARYNIMRIIHKNTEKEVKRKH